MNGKREKGMSGDVREILQIVDGLRCGQSRILERLASLETARAEDDKRVALFWSKDWAEMANRIEKVESHCEGIVQDFARINGIPTKNDARISVLEAFKWKAVGMASGAGMVGAGIGVFLMEIIVSRIINGE